MMAFVQMMLLPMLVATALSRKIEPNPIHMEGVNEQQHVGQREGAHLGNRYPGQQFDSLDTKRKNSIKTSQSDADIKVKQKNDIVAFSAQLAYDSIFVF